MLAAAPAIVVTGFVLSLNLCVCCIQVFVSSEDGRSVIVEQPESCPRALECELVLTAVYSMSSGAWAMRVCVDSAIAEHHYIW